MPLCRRHLNRVFIHDQSLTPLKPPVKTQKKNKEEKKKISHGGTERTGEEDNHGVSRSFTRREEFSHEQHEQRKGKKREHSSGNWRHYFFPYHVAYYL